MNMNLIPQTTRNGRWLTDFDRLFDRFFTATAPAPGRSVDAEENDKNWLLRLDLPGFRKDEVNLSV